MSMYTSAQKRLHWVVAALIAGQFLLQGAMHRAMERLAADNAVDFTGFLVTTWHSLAGVTIGGFMVWRWILRQRQTGSPAVRASSSSRTRVATAVHLAMYASVGVMVVSGLLNYYAGLPFSADVHAVCKWVLASLVVAHVLAALWHHFVRRDAVLANMLGSTRRADTIRSQ